MKIETQIAEYIESMFLRPEMYAINGITLEMTILTAMHCWVMSVEFDQKRLRTLWREQVPVALPNVPHGYATISLGLGPDREESQKVAMKRVVEHMKILWNKIKNENSSINPALKTQLRDVLGEKPLSLVEAGEKFMEYCRKHGLSEDGPRKILHHYKKGTITELELISAMIRAVGRGALKEFNEHVKDPLRSKVLETARAFVDNPDKTVIIGGGSKEYQKKIHKESQAGAEILNPKKRKL